MKTEVPRRGIQLLARLPGRPTLPGRKRWRISQRSLDLGEGRILLGRALMLEHPNPPSVPRRTKPSPPILRIERHRRGVQERRLPTVGTTPRKPEWGCDWSHFPPMRRLRGQQRAAAGLPKPPAHNSVFPPTRKRNHCNPADRFTGQPYPGWPPAPAQLNESSSASLPIAIVIFLII